ncbi:MAG: glycosyltransferase family 39 protein [Nitrospirae bacterium]|nr:glycosyltransferase family 39 protein [Nitrospirota bacterium]
MKFPGTALMYAIFMTIFGRTSVGIHLGLFIVNVLCMILVYQLGRRMGDRETALFASGFYGILTLSQSVDGVFAHATHFVVLFVLAGLAALLKSFETDGKYWLFVSGFCFGVAILMKQHAALFVLFGAVLLADEFRRIHGVSVLNKARALLLFIVTAAFPVALLAVAMWYVGLFNKFYFWTVQYAFQYAVQIPLEAGARLFANSATGIVGKQPLIWLLAAIGFFSLLAKRRSGRNNLFIFGFAVCSFLAITPGLVFREHYFILVLPVIALFAAEGLSSARYVKFVLRWMPGIVLALAVSFGMYVERDYFFTFSPDEVSRALYMRNPFPEARVVADMIAQRTSEKDRILVLGSEPEIYFYAKRRAATGHIYMYGLMENQPFAVDMQDEMISQIEQTRPAYIVYANVSSSWGVTVFSNIKVLLWANNYLNRSYEIVGYMEMLDPNRPIFIYGDVLNRYGELSGPFLAVYKRIS